MGIFFPGLRHFLEIEKLIKNRRKDKINRKIMNEIIFIIRSSKRIRLEKNYRLGILINECY